MQTRQTGGGRADVRRTGGLEADGQKAHKIEANGRMTGRADKSGPGGQISADRVLIGVYEQTGGRAYERGRRAYEVKSEANEWRTRP